MTVNDDPLFTIGIEEEYLRIDPETRDLAADRRWCTNARTRNDMQLPNHDIDSPTDRVALRRAEFEHSIQHVAR